MANLPQIQFENLYTQDPTGQKIWRYFLGEKTFTELQAVYSRMGKNGALATPHAAVTDKHPPALQTHTPVGERIDHIHHHPSYRELQRLSYGSEIVSLKYDSNFLKNYKNQRHLIGFSVAYYLRKQKRVSFAPSA